MKTALEILGKIRFNRYKKFCFLRADEILGEEKFYSEHQLIRAMKQNYAYYYCQRKGYRDSEWCRVYEELVSKNIYELECHAMEEAMKGRLDLNDAKNFA